MAHVPSAWRIDHFKHIEYNDQSIATPLALTRLCFACGLQLVDHEKTRVQRSHLG
jgi:hypothetical protein